MTKRSGRETSYQEPQGAAESREPKYVLVFTWQDKAANPFKRSET